MRRNPVISTRAIPSSDFTFRRVVDAVVADASSDQDLERRLRGLYPDVTVSKRELSGEPLVLYVYRDGHYARETHEAWWLAPRTAWVTISRSTGWITDANDGWAELMGADPSRLVGRPYTDFLLPEALPAAEALLKSIMNVGEARSRVVMVRPDGALIPIEFRAVLESDDVRVWYRPV